MKMEIDGRRKKVLRCKGGYGSRMPLGIKLLLRQRNCMKAIWKPSFCAPAIASNFSDKA
jgi:hypothetical protein